MTDGQKQPNPDHQDQILAASRARRTPPADGTRLTPSEIRARAKAGLDSRLERLKSVLSERQHKWLLETPDNCVSRRTKALLGEATLLQAIRAKCENCVGWEEIPKRVGDCRSRDCELWSYRPFQEEQGKHPEKRHD